MRIKNDDYVVVFRLPNDMSFKSYFSDCEILLNYNDLVAVFEETCTLAIGSGTYRINWNKYMNLVQGCNIDEMSYAMYLNKYREHVLQYNPDAPVIATINESINPDVKDKMVSIAGANILLQRY